MAKILTDFQKGQVSGLCIAIVHLCANTQDHSLATEIYNEANLTIKELRACGIPQSDIDLIKKKLMVK